MRIGVVIGTSSTLPYVHLQLESHRRFCPGCPILVHDDTAKPDPQIKTLCESYGAAYYLTPRWLSPTSGDLHAMIYGLSWARENRCEWLVKRSRRFVPTAPWLEDFTSIAAASPFPTLSSWCRNRGYGFLTTCIAMAVGPWIDAGGQYALREHLQSYEWKHPETFVHQVAAMVAKRAGGAASIAANSALPADRGWYANWPLVADGDQYARNDRRLWKDGSSPKDYADLAREWELAYRAEDFTVDEAPYRLGAMYERALQDVDMGRHIPRLRRLAEESRVVVELGTGRCASTMAFLMGQPDVLITRDIAQIACAQEIEELARRVCTTRVIVEQGDSKELAPIECDLLFIDTYHIYDQLAVELERHGIVAKKIALHDTESFGAVGEGGHGGLWPAIMQFCAAHDYEIAFHTEEQHGLTVLVRPEGAR